MGINFGPELSEKLRQWIEEHPEWKRDSVIEKPSRTPITCDLCQDTGWVRYDLPIIDPGFGQAHRCICRVEDDRRQSQEALLRYCQLPQGAIDMTFAAFEVSGQLKEAYMAARELRIERKVPFLLTLFGPRGCGKTHLGIAACHAWMGQGLPAKYIHVVDMLSDLRAGYADKRRGYDDRLALYRNVPLLVMDDFGTQQGTDWALEQLDTLIDHRYIERLHTVVTTNGVPDDLPERIADRLMDRRFGVCVGIDADSYRRTSG